MKERKLNYFEMKRSIERLENLTKRNAEHSEYLPILKKVVGNLRCLKATSLLTDIYYRGRHNEVGRLFNNISELTYPKKENVKKKNRLNDIGETILYASNSELGTIIEMDLKRYTFFTISKIRMIDKEIHFVPIGIPGKVYSPIPNSRAEELVLNYFDGEITKMVNDPNEYNSTIALAHLFLDDPVFNTKMGKMAGIIYPSAKCKNVSNKVTYNIAIQADIFDCCFKFEEIYIYTMTLETYHPEVKDNFWQLTGVNKVRKINDNGSLEWLFDFEEMKDRVSKGLIVEGGTCDNLRYMSDNL